MKMISDETMHEVTLPTAATSADLNPSSQETEIKVPLP